MKKATKIFCYYKYAHIFWTLKKVPAVTHMITAKTFVFVRIFYVHYLTQISLTSIIKQRKIFAWFEATALNREPKRQFRFTQYM